jgi:hypothetical protein
MCFESHDLFGLEHLYSYLSSVFHTLQISAGSQVLTDLFVALSGAVQKW